MKNSFKPLVVVAVGLILFFLFIFVSEIIDIADRLSKMHPSIAWVFYVFVGAFLLFFFIIPIFQLFLKPSLNLKELDGESPSEKEVKRAVRIITRKGRVELEEKQSIQKALKESNDVRVPLRAIIDKRAEGIDADIWKYSKAVFITTAISQFGKLDAFFLIVNNFQMLKLIFARYPYRPSLFQMVHIYVRVLILSLTALSIEELSDRSIIEEIFPRIHPIGGRTLASVVQGVTYAFITYRIGLFAKEFFMMPKVHITKETKEKIRKTAFKKSMEIARSIVTDIPVNLWKKLLKPFK